MRTKLGPMLTLAQGYSCERHEAVGNLFWIPTSDMCAVIGPFDCHSSGRLDTQSSSLQTSEEERTEICASWVVRWKVKTLTNHT